MTPYQLFRNFLREEGCEAAFDRAFYLHNDYTQLDESLWEASDASAIIGHAFNWSATPEGREYWLAIDKKWFLFITKQLLIIDSYDTCNT